MPEFLRTHEDRGLLVRLTREAFLQRWFKRLSQESMESGVQGMGRLLLAPWPIVSIGAAVASTPLH